MRSRSLLLLLGWMAIATLLRFLHLGDLPPWTDEFATTVFSLGHRFAPVPLDQLIDGATLLGPAQLEPQLGLAQVPASLFAESTHPPLYFMLQHLWLRLGSSLGGQAAFQAGLVSITLARSLSALLGVLSVPAGFGLSWVALRSPLAAQLTAALLAVSPLNLAWGREARHYPLALLLVMASLACFVRAVQGLKTGARLPRWVVVGWVLSNGAGVATHYLFVLSLGAQALVLLRLAPTWRSLRSVCVPVAATVVATLAWLPALPQIRTNAATDWISSGGGLERWLLPPLQLLLWNLSAVTQFPAVPTTGLSPLVMGLSAIAMLTFAVWLGLRLREARGKLRSQLSSAPAKAGFRALAGYLAISLLLFALLTYGFGVDLSRAPRFGFLYFPALMVLLGGLLAAVQNPLHRATVLSVAFVGAIVVIANGSYLQHSRPDLIADLIRAQSAGEPVPTIIATTHRHHGHTGRLMGIEWSLRQRAELSAEPSAFPQYFLAHREPEEENYEAAIARLTTQLQTRPRPFDLWLLNFRSGYAPDQVLGCERGDRGHLGEYRYKLYRCR